MSAINLGKKMEPINGLIYDCEIVKCIPSGNLEPGLQYCDGWTDFANMGISCICCWDLLEDMPRIFLGDNLQEFQALANLRHLIVGFNSISFDDSLCSANGLKIETNYDLLCEVRIASGQPPLYTPGKTRPGYSLNNLALANLSIAKSGSGELAPKLWQQGKFGEVIDYCMRDVVLVKKLLQLKQLRDPVDGSLLTLQCELQP